MEFWKELIQRFIERLSKSVLAVTLLWLGVAFSMSTNNIHNPHVNKIRREYSSNKTEPTFIQQLLDDLKAENIENNLKFLTKRVHLAGSPRNNELGETIQKTWKSYKFDKVEKVRYKVLLSYPGSRNKLQVISSDGKVKTTYYSEDKIVQPDEDDKQRIPPYLAYSRSGNVSGEVVYANFGREKDFEYLNQMGISVNGKIAVIRYGRIFRGDKVQTAAKYGVSGVILYNDPEETAPFGKYRVYPKEPWLPFDSVQMGTIFVNGGLSNSNSEKHTFGKSYPDNFSTYLPSILLSTNNAIEIIKNMKGPEAPKHWRGKLPISYRFGPGLHEDNHIKFEVHSKLVHRSIYNIIATINGRDEPDRIVLFGNHRDAWQFGGVDPSSGTAVLLEVSRGLSNLRKQGWRPRRTIMLCSWDAEEFGIIGSTMWVKENQNLLTERAVFYLNMDYAVQGNYTLEAQGSSALKELTYDETKKVADPNSKPKDNESMFDIWKRRAPSPCNDNMPNWGKLDGASDFLAFNQLIGVPSSNIRYGFNSHGVSYYPVYHTVHDTFAWVKKFVDSQFLFHLSMAKLTCRLLLRVADSLILPFNIESYGSEINEAFKKLKTRWDVKMKKINIRLNPIEKALKRFKEITRKFEKKKRSLKCCKHVRAINDQIFKLEHIFLVSEFGHSQRHNVIFGKGASNAYEYTWFPDLVSALVSNNRTSGVNEIKRQISLVYQAISSASTRLELVKYLK